MAFDSFADFVAMGKHGFYVWLVYGAAVVAVAALVISARAGQRRILADIEEERRS